VEVADAKGELLVRRRKRLPVLCCRIYRQQLKHVPVTFPHFDSFVGSPVVLSAIVNWRIVDPVAAALEVESVLAYVKAMGMAVLKSVASGYPYESADGHSLKGETTVIQEQLVNALQLRVKAVGIEVLRFSLTDLSYSSSVAGALLVKQSAEALVQARQLLVRGAVGIAHTAVERLNTDGTRLSPEEKTRLVTNLLSVVCGDSRVQPIITLS